MIRLDQMKGWLEAQRDAMDVGRDRETVQTVIDAFVADFDPDGAPMVPQAAEEVDLSEPELGPQLTWTPPKKSKKK